MVATPVLLPGLDGAQQPVSFRGDQNPDNSVAMRVSLEVGGIPVSTIAPGPVSDAALGAPAEAAWSGSGIGSVIAVLKKIVGLLVAQTQTLGVAPVVAPLDYGGNASATVGTSSGVLIVAGTYTRLVTITTLPNSTANVWLRPDNTTAAPNTGIPIQGGGGSITFGTDALPLPITDMTAVTDGGLPQVVTMVGG